MAVYAWISVCVCVYVCCSYNTNPWSTTTRRMPTANKFLYCWCTDEPIQHIKPSTHQPTSDAIIICGSERESTFTHQLAFGHRGRILNLNYLISVWLSPTWEVGSAVITKSARSVHNGCCCHKAESEQSRKRLQPPTLSTHPTLLLREKLSHRHFNSYQWCSVVEGCRFVAVYCLRCRCIIAVVVLIWLVCCASSTLLCSEYLMAVCVFCQGTGCGWLLHEIRSSKRTTSVKKDVADAVKLQFSCPAQSVYFI